MNLDRKQTGNLPSPVTSTREGVIAFSTVMVSLGWRALIRLDWLACEPRGSSCGSVSISSVIWLQTWVATFSFWISSWDWTQFCCWQDKHFAILVSPWSSRKYLSQKYSFTLSTVTYTVEDKDWKKPDDHWVNMGVAQADEYSWNTAHCLQINFLCTESADHMPLVEISLFRQPCVTLKVWILQKFCVSHWSPLSPQL